jgi:hypothetical protein
MEENTKIKKKSLKESIATILESIEDEKNKDKPDTKRLKHLKAILKRLQTLG